MLWSERSVQGQRRRTDRAIHRAGAQLASDPSAYQNFHELVLCVRQRAARLFEASDFDGRDVGVDSLVNLARFHGAHIRPISAWAGTLSSWRPALASLADHLLCEYDVPMFLASAWYAADAGADRKRGWFVAHARGASFRSLDLPIAMTRKMEHIFLASQDHLPIEHAIRRAELLGLGVPRKFVGAIVSTPLAADLRCGEFWRTVWMFLIANAGQVDPEQIGPMIDYIQAVRRNELPANAVEEWTGFRAPQVAFSMKGRTVQSMLRLMRDWHRSLAKGTAAFSWARSPFEPWLFEEPRQDDSEKPKRWQIIELTDSAQLRREGAALHHCVASYADRCYRGLTSIWSLRAGRGDTLPPLLTVEVDLTSRAIVQARGRANRAASGKLLRLLQEWAARERIRMSI